MGIYPVTSTLRFFFGRTKTIDTAQYISDFYRIILNYMHVIYLFNVERIMFILSWSCARELPRNALADAGFVCDKASVLRETIKGTPCIFVSNL
jgi:hypothetical protein